MGVGGSGVGVGVGGSGVDVGVGVGGTGVDVGVGVGGTGVGAAVGSTAPPHPASSNMANTRPDICCNSLMLFIYCSFLLREISGLPPCAQHIHTPIEGLEERSYELDAHGGLFVVGGPMCTQVTGKVLYQPLTP